MILPSVMRNCSTICPSLQPAAFSRQDEVTAGVLVQRAAGHRVNGIHTAELGILPPSTSRVCRRGSDARMKRWTVRRSRLVAMVVGISTFAVITARVAGFLVHDDEE
jgi:hypothetical protein